MTPTQTGWKYLTRKSGSLYQQLYVLGRVAARTLYGQHLNAEEPRTVEELAVDYALPAEAVEEALTYCRGNPPEIERDFRREEALVAASGGGDANGSYQPLSARQWSQINSPSEQPT